MKILSRINRIEVLHKDSTKNKKRLEALRKLFAYTDLNETPPDSFFIENRFENLRGLFHAEQPANRTTV